MVAGTVLEQRILLFVCLVGTSLELYTLRSLRNFYEKIYLLLLFSPLFSLHEASGDYQKPSFSQVLI